MSRISISDTSNYKSICYNAATNEDSFNSFKRHADYNSILEHVNEQEGGQYLEYINQHFPEYKEYLDKFKENDNVGGPVMFNYGEVGMISPTTLRYIKVLADLKKLFGSLDDFRIVEIGCGYGGQCKIINDYFKPKEYLLFDLPESNMLIKKYVEKQGLSNTKILSLEEFNPEPTESFDLIISNYALSEIRTDIQMEYFNKIISRSKRGYLTLNFIGHIFGVNTLNKEQIFDILSKNYKIGELREEPLTEANNTIVFWKDESNSN